jgi:hypothetical protein
MKKSFFAILMVLLAINMKAQWNESQVSNKITTFDNIGIGTTEPMAKLQVVTWENAISWPIILNNIWNNETVSDYGVGLKLKHSSNNENDKWCGIASIQENAWANKSGLALFANETEYVRIKANGNVGIGTTETGTHKLAVDGSIGAKEIKVETEWSDFVFDDEYELKSIEEVEQYIKENGHLPSIPDQETVEKDGVNLGEMNAKLLQKIEELTLYTIEQNKQIVELKKQTQTIEEIKRMMELQNEEIKKLKAASK